MYGSQLRLLSVVDGRRARRRVRAGRFLRPDGRRPGLHRRRSSTSTCRWRSSRWAGSSSAGSWRSSTCARGDARYDLRSYVAIHLSLVLGVGVLMTGVDLGASRHGATGGCGTSRRSCSFLIVFLLYCTYQPLRFSIEDPEQQSRYASVFAITAGAFVPLNFLAVRLAEPLHPPARAATRRRRAAGRDEAAVLSLPCSAWRCSS